MCLRGIAGLTTDIALIRISIVCQLIVCIKVDQIRLCCSRLYRIMTCACYTGKRFIGKEGSCDRSQIIRACIMIFIMQTVCSHKMTVRAAKLCSLCIHHVHKTGNRTGNMFSDCIADFICGIHENTIQALFHRNGLSDIHSHVGGFLFNAEYSLIGKFHHIIQIGIFNSNESC